jgi:hypothetical protein
VSHIETALNLAWALSCVGALLLNWLWDRKAPRKNSHKVQIHRTLSVFLATVSLFPCVSASDDRVRLSNLGTGIVQQNAFDADHRDNLPLAAQLAALEHAQTSQPFVLTLGFCFHPITRTELAACVRIFPCAALGRAPPAA